MKAVAYTPDKYKRLADWWTAHGWDPVAECVLPKIGLIVINESGDLLAAGFMYHDPSAAMGQMEWIVTNTEIPPMTAVKALHFLVSEMEAIADAKNILLFTSLKNDLLCKLYESHNFIKTDEGATNMLRPPQGGN